MAPPLAGETFPTWAWPGGVIASASDWHLSDGNLVEGGWRQTGSVAMRRALGHACSPHRSTACADPVQTTSRQPPDQDWRALHGPTPERMAPLADQPGEIGFCDVNKVNRVEITLRGEPFPHLLAA